MLTRHELDRLDRLGHELDPGVIAEIMANLSEGTATDARDSPGYQA